MKTRQPQTKLDLPGMVYAYLESVKRYEETKAPTMVLLALVALDIAAWVFALNQISTVIMTRL